MAIKETETITSLDLNFSNGGGSHSASIQTVLKAKDLANSEDELGSLIGSSGNKTTFSNSKIQSLMSAFIQIEKTVSQDGNLKKISRKYEDITSLKLKSHCFVVRGRDCHPHDKGLSQAGVESRTIRNITINGSELTGLGSSNPNGQYTSFGGGEYATMPYFGELPNSPIKLKDQLFPFKQPRKFGGVIIIGNIYNEESSVTSDGDKTSLVYQDGVLKEEFSYNQEKVSSFYKFNPDLANYNLKIGYTLAEAKRGFAQAGINIIGLPESVTNKVLFEESGTLDSILSNIASKYGYYWFVDPFRTGVIRFVNSSSASQLSVTNPLTQSEAIQSKYLNASFSENNLTPRIVNCFSSTIEKKNQTFEFGTGQRFTRFHKLDTRKLLQQAGISKNLIRVYYGLFLAGRFDAEAFDIISYFAAYLKKNDIDWGEWWEDSSILANAQISSWDSKVAGKGMREYIEARHDSAFKLKDGNYLPLVNSDGTKAEKPSNGRLFGLLRDWFTVFTNTIYLSNKFSRWKAKRMQWGGSPMNISGPYKISGSETVKIKDVDDLQSIEAVLTKINAGGRDLTYLFDSSDSSGSSDYAFIGRVESNQRNLAGRKKKDLDYDLINEKEYFLLKNPFTNRSYFGFSDDLAKQVQHLIEASASMFNDVSKNDSTSTSNTIKVYFTRAKRPSDEEETEETRKEEEAAVRRQAGLDALAEKLSEVGERFDIRYFNLKNNGASGDPLSPVTLDVKNGKISDILSLESSNISTRQSKGQTLKSSSRTIVGLSLPDSYKITLSALSVQLTGSGVTTTINESTKHLLPPDQQMIIDSSSKAAASNNIAKRFSASQRNLFGL